MPRSRLPVRQRSGRVSGRQDAPRVPGRLAANAVAVYDGRGEREIQRITGHRGERVPDGGDQAARGDAAASGRLRAAAILFVVAACGWVVMEMEILGARILAPYFGSAVYVVMGSVIGVFLISLAAGYAVGGWLSDRPSSQLILGAGLTVAGLWLAGIPLVVEPLCDGLLEAGFDEKWGSLTTALVLFGVPMCLLGTVSPTAVRWLTARAENSGRNAGLVLAFSTTASFAGCIATAFYLVRLSMRRTVWTSGGGLALLGLVVLLHALLSGRGAPTPPEGEEPE